MIDVNGNIKIPSKWEELNPKQAIDTVGLIMAVMGGAIPLKAFRVLLLQVITGYKRSQKWLPEDQLEQLSFNLLYLAEQLTFAIKPCYRNPEVLAILSPQLQEQLKDYFPFEIYEPYFMRELATIGSRLEFDPVPSLGLTTNPIPELKVKGKKYLGPVFSIDGHGVVTTDIRSGEFLLANDYADIYQKTGDLQYLTRLMAVYYRPDRERFSQVAAEKMDTAFAPVDVRKKYLCYLFHSSIIEFLNHHTVYGILFRQGEAPESTGNHSSVLYQMAKENYGSIQEVSFILLSDFIGLMYKQLLDAVSALHSAEKNPGEISAALNLTEDQTIEILRHVNH